MLKFLQGRKTYIAASALIVLALVALALGALDAAHAALVIAGALTLAGLRNGMAQHYADVLVAIEQQAQAKNYNGAVTGIVKFFDAQGNEVAANDPRATTRILVNAPGDVKQSKLDGDLLAAHGMRGPVIPNKLPQPENGAHE